MVPDDRTVACERMMQRYNRSCSAKRRGNRERLERPWRKEVSLPSPGIVDATKRYHSADPPLFRVLRAALSLRGAFSWTTMQFCVRRAREVVENHCIRRFRRGATLRTTAVFIVLERDVDAKCVCSAVDSVLDVLRVVRLERARLRTGTQQSGCVRVE
jgi:hypothetical protein